MVSDGGREEVQRVLWVSTLSPMKEKIGERGSEVQID